MYNYFGKTLFVEIYYVGMSIGRFASGLLSNKIKTWKRIFIGCVILAPAIVIMLLPLHGGFAVVGLFLIGLGNGCVSHEPLNLTPVVNADGKGLRAVHRKFNNGDLLILFRETGENGEYFISLPSLNGYLLDLTNGELQHIEAENGIFKISLAVGETAVVLLTDDVLNAENKNHFKEKFNITGEFLFKKETELVCNENGFNNIKHSEEAVSVQLGDWSLLVGSAYSGSGVYETNFTLPIEKAGKKRRA